MTRARYVVVALGHPRAEWFGSVGRWANAALLPMELIRCVSREEVLAHVAAGRRISAALVDGGSHDLDRDLAGRLAAVSCPVVVVGPQGAERARTLGVAAVIDAPLDPAGLAAVLEQVAIPVGQVVPTGAVDAMAPERHRGAVAPTPSRGRLVAVTGGACSGTSTTAMALAQGLAAAGPDRDRVILADCALEAHQGVMHAAPDVAPCLSELVDAHRAGVLGAEGVARLTFADERRGYRLLLGLRRRRDWTALRPRAVDAAIESLRSSATVVVADADADLDGEAECGSPDVEDRNVLARTVVGGADLVLVTASPDLVGLHRYARVVHHLLEVGVPADRLQPVVCRGPASPARRAALARALAQLVAPLAPGAAGVATPVHLPAIRGLDDLLRDARPLPSRPAAGIARAVRARLGTLEPSVAPTEEPVPVAPGTLGSWFDDEAVGA